MKISKMVKSGLILSALTAQSVFAGQPYAFGTLDKDLIIPEGLNAFIVPSIKSNTDDIQIINKEVWLIPTDEFIFSAIGAPNPLPLDATPEHMCSSITELEGYVKEYDRDMRRERKNLLRAKTEEERQQIRDNIAMIQEWMKDDKTALKELSHTPALEVNGTWDDGFTAARDRLVAVNPGLKVQKAPMVITQINPSGAVNSSRPVFTNLEINGQVFNNLAKEDNHIIRPETKPLSDSLVESTDGEEGVSLFKANQVSGKVINDPGMNGIYSATIALGTACKYFESNNSGNAIGSLSFQVIRTFPSVRFIKAKARYTASKVYTYFKEVSQGPDKGWNVFKSEVSQKIRENTGENEDFSFDFQCEDYYPNGSCESKREEIEEKLRNFLINQAANVFANFAIDANSPDTLPLPENKLGDVAGMAGSMMWGPGAGALIKGAVDLFTSSSSTVDVQKSFNKEVNEEWSSRDFTPILSSQAGKVNFSLN